MERVHFNGIEKVSHDVHLYNIFEMGLLGRVEQSIIGREYREHGVSFEKESVKVTSWFLAKGRKGGQKDPDVM